MIANPDGTFTIQNSQTGEKRTVTADQLPQYGLSSPSQGQNSFLQGQTIPVAGGIIGGTVGSLAGPFTGIAGAGAGYVGADTLRKNLLSLLGNNSQQGLPSVLNTAKGGLLSAGEQAIGEGAAKALGFIAHPIQPFIERVNSLVKGSPAMVNLADTLAAIREQGGKLFAKNTISSQFPDAFKTVSSDLLKGAHELMTPSLETTAPIENQFVSSSLDNSIPGQTLRRVNIVPSPNFPDFGPNITNNPNVPVDIANQLKRGFGSQASGYYGQQGPTIIELKKIAQNVLKNQIEQQVPGVALPNKIASLIYKAGDLVNPFSYIIPGGSFGAGRALRMSGAPISKLFGNILPYGGGYLNQVIPALIQASNPPPSQ